MKSYKINLIFTILLLCFGQLSAQNFTLTAGTETFESIYAKSSRWPNHNFGKHPFIIDFDIQGFGKADSIRFGLSTAIVYSSAHNGEFWIGVNSRNEGKSPEFSDIWWQIRDIDGEKVLIIEYRASYEDFPNMYGEYQIRFYQNSGKIRYHYGKPGFIKGENEDILIGIDQIGVEPEYIMYLNGDPHNPKVATAVPEVRYLDDYPAENTYYDFTPNTTSIGNRELAISTSVTQTQNGFRIQNHNTDIQADLLNAEGKLIANGQNYGSPYIFLIPQEIKQGLFLIRVTETATGKSATIKVLRN